MLWIKYIGRFSVGVITFISEKYTCNVYDLRFHLSVERPFCMKPSDVEQSVFPREVRRILGNLLEDLLDSLVMRERLVDCFRRTWLLSERLADSSRDSR